MADITAVGEEHPSPTQDELQQATAGNGAAGDNRTPKRRMSDDEEDDEKQGRERRKIEIKFIQDKSRRHITFSKRKAGIMKKVCFASFPPVASTVSCHFLFGHLFLLCSFFFFLFSFFFYFGFCC